MRRSALALIVVAFVAASAATVFAHMRLSKTEPAADSILAAPPAKVQVWFTQNPDPKVSKLTLVGPAGPVKLVDFKASAADKSLVATIDGPLSEGKFTASWQAAGNDGHIQKGSYSFSVKATR